MRLRPKWNCPTLADEATFKAFIFHDLDRREALATDAMAAVAQSDETLAMFLDMLRQTGGKSPDDSSAAPRGRGAPKTDIVERRLLPSEDAARTVTTVREIFEDYWDKWNRGRPSAEEIAAEYVGVKVSQVRSRLKKAKGRRPE